jgi:hypothetical protein
LLLDPGFSWHFLDHVWKKSSLSQGLTSGPAGCKSNAPEGHLSLIQYWALSLVLHRWGLNNAYHGSCLHGKILTNKIPILGDGARDFLPMSTCLLLVCRFLTWWMTASPWAMGTRPHCILGPSLTAVGTRICLLC